MLKINSYYTIGTEDGLGKLGKVYLKILNTTEQEARYFCAVSPNKFDWNWFKGGCEGYAMWHRPAEISRCCPFKNQCYENHHCLSFEGDPTLKEVSVLEGMMRVGE